MVVWSPTIETSFSQGVEGGGSDGDPFAVGNLFLGELIEIGVYGAAGREEDPVKRERGEVVVDEYPISIEDRGVEVDAGGADRLLTFLYR